MTLAAVYPLAVAVGLGLGVIAIACAAVRSRERMRFGRAAGCCGAAAAIALLALAVTAFQAAMRGVSLHGWPLFLHVGAGGGFVFFLALTAILSLPALLDRGAPDRPDRATRLGVVATLLCGALAAAPIAASMFALGGTLATERLLDVHRWAGLGAFVLGTVTAARIVRRRGTGSGGTGRLSGSGALGDTY